MKTCLVVADSKVVRMVTRKILEELDFAVVEAEGGETAIEECRKDLPDNVLCDWDIPPMDGIAFLNSLRALPGGEDVSVFFLEESGTELITMFDDPDVRG